MRREKGRLMAITSPVLKRYLGFSAPRFPRNWRIEKSRRDIFCTGKSDTDGRKHNSLIKNKITTKK